MPKKARTTTTPSHIRSRLRRRLMRQGKPIPKHLQVRRKVFKYATEEEREAAKKRSRQAMWLRKNPGKTPGRIGRPRVERIPNPYVPVDPSLKPKRPKKYLNNADLTTQIIISKKKGRMTEELGKMFLLMTKRIATKPNFSGYTYREEMEGYALVLLCKGWANYNEVKYKNPFAYYTQVILNSFKQYLNSEKRQHMIRDELLVLGGMNPSWNYQGDDNDKRNEEGRTLEQPNQGDRDSDQAG